MHSSLVAAALKPIIPHMDCRSSIPAPWKFSASKGVLEWFQMGANAERQCSTVVRCKRRSSSSLVLETLRCIGGE